MGAVEEEQQWCSTVSQIVDGTGDWECSRPFVNVKESNYAVISCLGVREAKIVVNCLLVRLPRARPIIQRVAHNEGKHVRRSPCVTAPVALRAAQGRTYTASEVAQADRSQVGARGLAQRNHVHVLQAHSLPRSCPMRQTSLERRVGRGPGLLPLIIKVWHIDRIAHPEQASTGATFQSAVLEL